MVEEAKVVDFTAQEGGDVPMKATNEDVPVATTEGANATDAAAKPERGPPPKQGRIIVRNLAFDLREKHLQKEFAKYGNIISCNVPLKNENNLNRGFGFVEFETKEQATEAITKMNSAKFKGRTLAVEFSVSKNTYEQRLDKIVENTNLTKEQAQQPKVIRIEKEVKIKAKEDEEKKKQEEQSKKTKLELKMEKIREKKAVKRAEKKKQAAKKNVEALPTLFVRNIGWDTTEKDFKEYMESFGPVKYAVLCRVNEFNDSENIKTGQQGKSETHKGSGFVKFADAEHAQHLLELSQKIEEKLDEERKKMKADSKKKNNNKKDTQENALLSSLSLMKNELELKGRRLIVMKQVAKDDVSKLKQDNSHIDKSADKRNLAMRKEGLLNEKDWIHKEPALIGKDLEQRQRLFMEKDKNLKKSTNLFVSEKRLQIRNLPKREFFEKELKELIVVVVDEWTKSLNKKQLNLSQKKKLIKQVKILRDQQKVDATTQEKLASGIAFVEFENQELSLFAVRYLNNMVLAGNKGLIVDFAVEDARALHKRQVKFDNYAKKRAEKEKEEQEINDSKNKGKDKKKDQEKVPDQVELGGKKRTFVERSNNVADCNDIEILKKMSEKTNSRGKKQRIKQKIQKLEEEQSGKPATQKKTSVSKDKDNSKLTAKDKVSQMLKKREDKLQRKEQSKQKTSLLNTEDKQILKDIKNKKKNQRKEQNKETDEFDDLLKKYKAKLDLKIGKTQKPSKKNDEPEFEEFSLSD